MRIFKEMIEVRHDRGIHLPREDIWLDPSGSRDFAFISHAHSDHTGRHREVILTEATSLLMRERLGKPKGVEHIVGFRQPVRFRDFEVELLPAGHVLGSAQCLIRTNTGTVLYTGDFRLRDGPCAEVLEHAQADILIMETTFGLPRYVFPPHDEVVGAIVQFCLSTIESGATPVLLAYSLGKAQEILAALTDTGLEAALHPSVWKMTRVYEHLGVRFPLYTQHSAEALAANAVLICPPNARASFDHIPRRRVAMLSGWAIDPRTIYRMSVDAAFPLSDHADYPDLLRYVEMVNPSRVFTHHGFAKEFARDLRAKGIEAWTLGGTDQLELLLG